MFFVGAWLVILMGFWGSSRWWVSTTPSSGGAGDDSGADSRRRRIDARDYLAPDPHRNGLRTVPAYLAADPGEQATLAATADTFAAIALVTNAAGNFLGFGVVVPLYAVAILTAARCRGGSDGLACSSGRSLDRWGCSARHPR